MPVGTAALFASVAAPASSAERVNAALARRYSTNSTCSLQTVDLLCFSSQYYFINALYGLGNVVSLFGVTIFLRTQYNPFGDPVMPLLIFITFVVCDFVGKFLYYLADVESGGETQPVSISDPSPSMPAKPAGPDLAIMQMLKDAELMHLSEQCQSLTWDDAVTQYEAGRPKMMSFLKNLGVAKLSERTAVVTAFGKAKKKDEVKVGQPGGAGSHGAQKPPLALFAAHASGSSSPRCGAKTPARISCCRFSSRRMTAGCAAAWSRASVGSSRMWNRQPPGALAVLAGAGPTPSPHTMKLELSCAPECCTPVTSFHGPLMSASPPT